MLRNQLDARVLQILRQVENQQMSVTVAESEIGKLINSFERGEIHETQKAVAV